MIDSGALISQLFSSFWWLLSLLIIAALFKSAWFKGFIGEVMVTWLLALFGSSCKAANGLEDIDPFSFETVFFPDKDYALPLHGCTEPGRSG